MSVFSDLMAGAGVDLLLSTSGQQIAITPDGGDAVTVWGIPGRKRVKESNVPTGGRKKEEVRHVQVCKVTGGTYGGVASVLLNAKVTFDGTDYTVRSIDAETDAFIRLIVVRSLSLEKTKPSYRRAV